MHKSVMSKRSLLVILAFFVLVLASAGKYVNVAFDANAVADVTKEMAEAEDDATETPELSIDIFNSLIQVSHLVFHSDLIFEFSLPEIMETKAHSVFDTALNFTKYYRTLFHDIISPNAP